MTDENQFFLVHGVLAVEDDGHLEDTWCNK
jgi:hypothetical protein